MDHQNVETKVKPGFLKQVKSYFVDGKEKLRQKVSQPVYWTLKITSLSAPVVVPQFMDLTQQYGPDSLER